MREKPNVLFVMTDQQRFDTVAALGNGHIHTPNLDRLVRRGLSFTHAYSTCPVCVPARYNRPHRLRAAHHEDLLEPSSGARPRPGRDHHRPRRRLPGGDHARAGIPHLRHRQVSQQAVERGPWATTCTCTARSCMTRPSSGRATPTPPGCAASTPNTIISKP